MIQYFFCLDGNAGCNSTRKCLRAAPVSGLYEFIAFLVGVKRLHILCNRVLFKLNDRVPTNILY